MTMAELTSLIGALSPVITGLAALAGVWLGAHLEAQRERLRAAARQDEGQRARIRDRDLRDLDETRLVLVGLLAWLEKRVVLGQVAAVQPSTDHLTRYNINLVADAAVIQTYGDLIVELQDALPMSKSGAAVEVIRGWLPRSLAEIDLDLVARIAKTRAVLLKTLDAQEERAMRDQPLAKLTPDELASVAIADAMVERMRERQRDDRPRT
jgi:hypothetical protein